MERMLILCLPLLLLRVSSGAQGTGGGSEVAPRGRFSTEHMQCTWTANDTGDSATLRVTCRSPEARAGLRCSYRGRPHGCPAFRSEPRRFWRQVGRALAKLRARLCRDERASVRAGMCRRAPGDAHFQLAADSSVFSARTAPPPPRPTSTSCAGGRADHRSTAEEYCSSAWASVCSFLLSMLQTDAC